MNLVFYGILTILNQNRVCINNNNMFIQEELI